MEIYLRQRYGIVCLITIALLLVFSHLYNHSSASRRFRRMCIYALCHVVLTILTEVTANLLDTTPLLVNRLLHLLCCATAIAFLGEMCWYIASITPLQGCSLQVVRIVTILIPFLFGIYLTFTNWNGIANGYTDDPRFKANFDKMDPRLAEFMRDAVKVYVESKK